MRSLRLSLIVFTILLLLVDVRSVSFLLHGPDVLQVVGEADALRVVPYRFTAVDYAAISLLIAGHVLVAFGWLRLKRTRGTASLPR